MRVYPIGFGTRNPTSMVCTAAQLGGRGFEGFGATRRCRRRRRWPAASSSPTRPPCARWPTVTGGEYFAATDADRLQNVLEDLPRTRATQHRDVEVSVGLVGLAALLLSSLWAAARWTAFPT